MKRFGSIPVMVLCVYVLCSISHIPLSALGDRAGAWAQVPRECYYLLPAAVLGAAAYTLIARLAARSITWTRFSTVVLLTALLARLLFLLYPEMFWGGDALKAFAIYVILCWVSFLALCTLLSVWFVKMWFQRMSQSHL